MTSQTSQNATDKWSSGLAPGLFGCLFVPANNKPRSCRGSVTARVCGLPRPHDLIARKITSQEKFLRNDGIILSYLHMVAGF